MQQHLLGMFITPYEYRVNVHYFHNIMDILLGHLYQNVIIKYCRKLWKRLVLIFQLHV